MTPNRRHTIVEAASGKPYFDYMEEQIFGPAGMTRSGFPAKDGSNPELAVGYSRGGPTGGRSDAAGPMKSNLGMLPLRGCPAGSSSHTAEDLLKLHVERGIDDVHITITDEGPGYDWEPYLTLAPERVFHRHGRGFAMARRIGGAAGGSEGQAG